MVFSAFRTFLVVLLLAPVAAAIAVLDLRPHGFEKMSGKGIGGGWSRSLPTTNHQVARIYMFF